VGPERRRLRCAALKTLLRRTVREVYDRGFHTFLCGMARGCDQYFAEAVLAARADGAQDAQLCALVPCPSQPDGWDEASVARYWALLAACDQLEVLEDHYSPGCMLRRNREMLPGASAHLRLRRHPRRHRRNRPPCRRAGDHGAAAVDVSGWAAESFDEFAANDAFCNAGTLLENLQQPFATKERYGCGSAACRYTSARQFASFLRKPVANPQHFQGRQSRRPLRRRFSIPRIS